MVPELHFLSLFKHQKEHLRKDLIKVLQTYKLHFDCTLYISLQRLILSMKQIGEYLARAF